MEKCRVGIIGCGGIAIGKHMPALARQKRAVMVAFCDVAQERATEAAKNFGEEGARVYTDYRALLEDTSIDVVHICTPNHSHAEIAIAAMEAGKHVMCEKPMAKTAGEARMMVETAKRTGKKLAIGYQNRYTPEVWTMKRAADAGEFGEIYYAKAHAVRRRAVPTWGVFLNEYEQGGGPLIDIGTHALDMTLWVMNNYKPAMVCGSVFRKLGNQTETGNAWGDWDPKEYTVEDAAFGFIKMENGATISLESSWALNIANPMEAKTTVCGTLGGADMLDGLRFNKVQYGYQTITKFDTAQGGAAFYEGMAESAADMECRLWLDAVLEDKEVIVKPWEALVVSEILEAIYTSGKTGKPVYLQTEGGVGA